MRTLNELLNSPDGLRFLESKGVFVAQQEFREQLKTPAKPNLVDMLGLQDTKLICSGQQLYIDYRQSVLSKIQTLHDFEHASDLFPFFLWMDTDRSGSDSLITKFAWPTSNKKGLIGIAPPGTKDIESRFVSLDESHLRSAMDKLVTHLLKSGEKRKAAKLKYKQLRAIFVRENPGVLSDFNHQVTYFLLNNHLGFSPYSVIISEVLNRGIVTDEVNLYINNLAGIVRVFNESVQSLIEQGIDPQVKPLHENYFPLFYSCEHDHQRLRLVHNIDGDDHYAVGACKHGHDYKFHLGTKHLSIAEIAQTNRWSPDVCMPAFFNDLVSGFVAGKSSTLYLIVINAVLRQVLDKSPVPILVPESLGQQERVPDPLDSLLYEYFNA